MNKNATLEISQILRGKKCLVCQQSAQKIYTPDATGKIIHFFCANFACFEKWIIKDNPQQTID